MSGELGGTTVGVGRRGRFLGVVVRNEGICEEHFRLVLRVEGFPASEPGQFLQIDCGDEEGVMAAGGEVCEKTLGVGGVLGVDFLGPRAYLRRPFSIAGRREVSGGSELDVIYRVVGKGTGALERLEMGACVSVIGPLGRGFRIPSVEEMDVGLLVGGGVGIPPMFYLAERMRAEGRRAVGFVGAQRKGLVPLTISPCMPGASAEGEPVLNATEFAEQGFATVVTTDDGSMGMKGYVTEAVRRFIEKEGGRKKIVVFCCGPTPMMRATAKLCEGMGVVCQVSLEQPMACGMGTCQSCVVRWKKQGASSKEQEGRGGGGWVYKLTCTDGPVFDSREIVWEKG